MKTLINKIIIIALLIGFTFSCKDEWVNVEPIATEDEGAFYLTQEDAEQAVTAVYAQLAYMTTWDREIQMNLGSIASDDAEAGGEDIGDVVEFQDFDKLTHLPSNQYLNNPFGVLYKAIFLANKALEKLPDIPKNDPEASAAVINERIGELKFLRALNHFYLTLLFGEVPLVDHVLGASEYEKPRSTFRALYDFIEKDLKDAISVLPAKRDGKNIGRATKGAAQALLAKLYLFESSYAKNYPNDSRFSGLKERWKDALDAAEDVINSGNYKLVGIDGEKYNTWRGSVDGYRFLFSSNGDNCAESVFEVQNINDAMNWLLSRGSSIINWSCARYYYDKTNAKQSSSYWGFNVPSEDLAKEFENGDPRFFTSIHISKTDNRLGVTINQPVNKINDSINLSDGWYPICYTNTVTGMYQAKYECSWAEFKGAGTGAWDEAPINTKILRYADVVLMAAEAAVMLGQNDKALKYINMIRKRARMCGDPGNTVPADLTGTVTLDQVKKERRVELCFEGTRFFDLVRWGDAYKKLNGMTLSWGFVVEFVPGKHEFFPIPQREVDLSKGALKQYDGWQ